MLVINYIISAWRNILRNKLFSTINILGLAIGLAACILISLFIRNELSYDKFWKNADEIYRVHMEFKVPGLDMVKMVWSSGPTMPALKREFPQIEYAARLNRQNPTIINGNDIKIEEINFVDPDFINIFDFNVVRGSLENTLNNSSSIALNQTYATRYFGNENPIDKTLTLDFGHFKKDYRVTAVFEDVPKNSQLEISTMIAINEEEWQGQGLYEAWYITAVETFYKLENGADNNDLIPRLPAFVDRNFPLFGSNAPDAKSSDVATIRPVNVKDLHLKSEGYGDIRPLGNQTIVVTFSAVAVLIVIIASINFMNLSTARASQRAKEVSLRKVMGASKQNLIIQFLGESVFLTLFALIIALLFVEISLPFYNQVLNTDLFIDYTSFDLIGIIVLALCLGLFGGAYPAFILSGFRPAEVLKANKSAETNASVKLRAILVVVQFSVSIALFVSTAVVYSQMMYANNMDLGYTKENLIYLERLNHPDIDEKKNLILEEVRRIPEVTSAALSGFGPAETGEGVTTMRTADKARGDNTVLNAAVVGQEFFKTYNIPLLAGREFDIERNDKPPSDDDIKAGSTATTPLILNQSALRLFGLGTPTEALGKSLYRDIGGPDETFQREFKIVGVIPDVYFYSLKKSIPATAYYLRPEFDRFMSIRYAGNPLTVVNKVENMWRQEAPNVPIKYQFVTDMVADQYNSEQGQLIMFAAFSALAIFIACLGLFGLASFAAERRTKEIGIRKVFGAEVWQIVKLLVWQFSKPVIIANIIAWPLSFYAMSRWLESFVYRIDNIIIIAMCLAAGLAALLIAWATVAGNSYAVARANPIKALRYE